MQDHPLYEIDQESHIRVYIRVTPQRARTTHRTNQTKANKCSVARRTSSGARESLANRCGITWEVVLNGLWNDRVSEDARWTGAVTT